MSDLCHVRAFIFDMDGVVYRGKNVLACAPEFFARLRRERIPYLFLTNNGTTPGADVAERLRGMGIEASAGDIITSADAVTEHLAHERPRCRVLVVGERGIRTALTAAGFTLVSDHRETDAVIVGLDREANYARIKEASLAVQAGALFLATNRDASMPTEEGLVPGAGAFVGMVEIASGRQAFATGKPSAAIFHQALARIGATPETAASVGDRPDTDIMGGQNAGMKTIAVLTGAGTREDFEAMQPRPDWIFDDLCELEKAYFGG